ncbi:MAG: HigA family addiction module antidote protein [Gammaproteobacteria bacterium]|nr:HigA family addiction module antidote protein [Gammaproteobacteria bacterium]
MRRLSSVLFVNCYISRYTLSKLFNGRIGISLEMAVRLAIVFKTDAEFWVNLQASYDLCPVLER